MQNVNDIIICLLIVDDSGENVEVIVSILCNSGIVVCLWCLQDVVELVQVLISQVIDLVLVLLLQGILLQLVVQYIVVSGKDILLVLLVECIDEDELVQVSSYGICVFVLCQCFEYLFVVVCDQWVDLQVCRGLCCIEVQMCEIECCCDVLIVLLCDLIVYVYEGMYICVNDVYLEMFGYEYFDDIEGILLLDMVVVQYVEGFKQLLKGFSCGEVLLFQYQFDVCYQDGSVFLVMMEFVVVIYEGEFCLQVVFCCCMEFDFELVCEVEDLCQCDQVIGLFNCLIFMLQLESVVVQVGCSEGQFGLLLIELDYYVCLLLDIGLVLVDILIGVFVVLLVEVVGEDV